MTTFHQKYFIEFKQGYCVFELWLAHCVSSIVRYVPLPPFLLNLIQKATVTCVVFMEKGTASTAEGLTVSVNPPPGKHTSKSVSTAEKWRGTY